jgi:hypothetical protein
MSLLEMNERKFLQQRLQDAGTAQIAKIYYIATGHDATFVMTSNIIVVSLEILGQISNDTQKLIIFCLELVAAFPNNPTNAELNAIATKLQTAVALQAVDPTEELWIGSEPMVNRKELRFLLKYLVNGHHFSVVYIAGSNMSGRSHSYHLIRHVARARGIPVHKIDFRLPTEARNLRHLFGRLKDVYGLGAFDEPTYEGATPGDVASKFALSLRTKLIQMPHVATKPWVVIDYTDEVPDPAVPEFLRMICAARDANDFDSCVIFVLGPTAHLDSIRTELSNLEVEETSGVNEDDIHKCAVAVNQRGKLPREPADLQSHVAAMFSAINALPEEARLAKVRQGLLNLRREVQAP